MPFGNISGLMLSSGSLECMAVVDGVQVFRQGVIRLKEIGPPGPDDICVDVVALIWICWNIRCRSMMKVALMWLQ